MNAFDAAVASNAIKLRGPQGFVFHGTALPLRWAFAPKVGPTRWFKNRRDAEKAFADALPKRGERAS